MITPKAVTILRRVQLFILSEPGRINMDDGLIMFEGEIITEYHSRFDSSPKPPCGTVGCIAYHIVSSDTNFVRDFVKNYGSWTDLEDCALRAIDESLEKYSSNGDGEYRMFPLFYPSHWPEDLQDKEQKLNPGTSEYSQTVVEAIDRWIDGEGSFKENSEDA